jgi:hypothetical protein
MNERVGLFCSKRGDRTGCTDKRGRIAIPFIYAELSPFSESGLALALQPNVGWVDIDQRNRRIGEALSVDNRPDETFGGHARFKTASGKIGFLDRKRRIIIPARYDAAFPFSNCKALVCVGCHPLRWSVEAPIDAACTGDAFLIDESGEKLQASPGADGEECEKKQRAP